MSETPEIRIIAPDFGDQGFLTECLDLECGFNDVSNTRDEAQEAKIIHEEWHENGMPE